MEKRKSKIVSLLDAVVEEKNLITENLNILCHQISSCSNFAQSSSDSSKHMQILNYEIEVLRKLSEINFELEKLAESNPIGIQVPDNEMEQHSLSQSDSISDHRDINNTAQIQNVSHYEINAHSLLSHNSIESVDSGPTTYSNEASTNVNFVNTTITEVSENISEVLQPDQLQCSNSSNIGNFEIPERDTDNINEETNPPQMLTPIASQPDVCFVDDVVNTFEDVDNEINVPPLLSHNSIESIVTDPTTYSNETSTNANRINTATITIAEVSQNVSEVLQPDQWEYSNSNNIVGDFEIPERDTDSNTNEETSPLHMLSPIVSQPEVCVVDDVIDTFEDVDNISSSQSDCLTQDLYSNENILGFANNKKSNCAIEKLNKYAINKQHLAAMYNALPLQAPDIRLKPASIGEPLRNVDDDTQVSTRKKKNKKKKKEVNTPTILLQPREFPKEGQWCLFSHIESPSEFYIHVEDENSLLIDILSEQINEYFQDSIVAYDSKEMACKLIGIYGFVFINAYGAWYRCQILDWCLERKTDEVIVRLVDYGNTCITQYKNLRRMNKELANIPMLAIRCYFPLLYPPGSTHLNRKKVWPQSSIEALANLSLLFDSNAEHKDFQIEYAIPNYEENSLAIDLISQDLNTQGKTIGQILLDLRFAEQLVESIDPNNMELEAFIEDIDTLEDALNINEAIVGYDAKDESRICRFTKSDGTCFKGKNCKLEHTKFSKDGITTDKEPVFSQAMYELILPIPNEMLIILITGYLDTCRFFAQIVRTPYSGPENKYSMDRSMHHLLEETNSEKIIKTYKQFRMLPPAVGEIVLVRHYWSNQWVRGMVKGFLDDDQNPVSVFTVDYGEYLKVKFSDLRKIQANFLKLPFQAVMCYIADYKMKDDCDVEKAKDFFFENIYFRNFTAEVLSSGEPMKIKLKSRSGMDIGEVLLEAGFAEKRSFDSNIKDDAILSPF